MFLSFFFKFQSRLAETEHEKKELDYQSRINRYEYAVKERDATIVQLQAKLDEHTEASEKMIERFRVQAEENSNKIFEELTSKVCVVMLTWAVL